MPIYDYRCTACGHTLEALQKITDALLVDCPHCHQPTLVKQLTAAAFRLKGSGWYESDFKSTNQRNLADKNTDTTNAESSKTSKNESKQTTSSDSH